MAEKKEEKTVKTEKKTTKAKTQRQTKSTEKTAKTTKTAKSKPKTDAKKTDDTPKEKSSLPFLMYKNRPLVRCGSKIYYGDMRGDYVVEINIENQEKKGNIDIASKVILHLIATKITDIKKKVIKTASKENLYFAIDVADAWLSRMEKKAKEEQEKIKE